MTRTPEGYDLALLEHLLQTHRPKVFFTQPRLHCPTGASATLAHMYRVLQLAEKYDVTLVENDIYSDLDPRPHPSLASLDQLKRVVYISSFSKTISPNLRVGYMAGHPELIEDLAQLKMIAGLTSAELLGPGHLFSPGLEPSPWLRFNIAFCEDEAVFDFLQQEIARAQKLGAAA